MASLAPNLHIWTDPQAFTPQICINLFLVTRVYEENMFWNQEGQITIHHIVLYFAAFPLPLRDLAFGLAELDFAAGVLVFFGGAGGASGTAPGPFTFFRMVLGCSGSKDISGYLGGQKCWTGRMTCEREIQGWNESWCVMEFYAFGFWYSQGFSAHTFPPGLFDFVCLHGCFAAPRQWLRAIHGQWPDQDWKLGK